MKRAREIGAMGRLRPSRSSWLRLWSSERRDVRASPGSIAATDELAEGVGYKLALPPPRNDNLADFRVLVIDTHPLCPNAASVIAALDGLVERLAKLGVHVVRGSAKLPDLALTTRIYVELLAAFFAADLPADAREAAEAAARSL